MVIIDLFKKGNIKTYADIVAAFNWCYTHLGPPGARRGYSKSQDSLGSCVINSPIEIEFLSFFYDKDATLFKLSHV